MKSFKYWYIFLFFSVLGISSCNKRLLVTGLNGKTNRKYDTAAFNYVYVEALNILNKVLK
jgi:hypothetical protein